MRKLTVTIVPNLISEWQELETEFRGVRANSISRLILHLFDVYCSPWKAKKQSHVLIILQQGTGIVQNYKQSERVQLVQNNIRVNPLTVLDIIIDRPFFPFSRCLRSH